MIRTILKAVTLITALVLLGAGTVKTHKVYEPDSAEDEFGILTFHRISERDLVVDATFSGVELINDRLITTYDRSSGGGKRPCPT